jgi:NAD+ kinase
MAHELLPIDLVIVRHGKSAGNGGKEVFHDPAAILTEEGRRQAKAAGKWIREKLKVSFEDSFTSDFLRARLTAGLLGIRSKQWTKDFRLRERNWGELEEVSHDERRAAFRKAILDPNVDIFDWTPPHGESMNQTCQRLEPFIHQRLSHKPRPRRKSIVVCHGGVLWGFRILLEEMSRERYCELNLYKDPRDKIHNGHIFHYTRRNPKTGEVVPDYQWMRSVCPWDLSLSHNEWEEIDRITTTKQAKRARGG